MALGFGCVRSNMTKLRGVILAIMVGSVLAGCGGEQASGAPTANSSGSEPTVEQPSGEGRVITGQEALELYGIASSPTPGPPTATPQVWFPARAWVEPSVLPYDPNETINFLPMFSSTELDDGGIWMGDLTAGQEVILHGVSADGRVCLVEGQAQQGWSTKGWVSCNRLRFTQE